ncbi:MAG: HNH endonuclease [Planctomycetaceae bacterium]
MDIRAILIQFQDYLASKLDTYEQVLYLYILRHTRLVERDEATIGFKSARRKMAFGVGQKTRPMSENTCYEKLRSLQSKGCIQLLDSQREGTRVRLITPVEIPGVVPPERPSVPTAMEEMDFFNVQANRLTILRREDDKCFYCLRQINKDNNVLEHVLSRRDGGNSYRNVVAACRQCNNRKGATTAEDFLRTLYREGFLGASEFEGRVSHLQRLLAGEIKPTIGDPN